MAVQATQMTEGNIAKQILLFSLPMLLSNLFQQMYNTADLIIVGNFIGDNALAAVGSSGPLIYMLIGFFQGLATGTSVLVAQAYGGADYKSVGKAVHTSIAHSLLTGALLTVIGTLFCGLFPPLRLFFRNPLYTCAFTFPALLPLWYTITAALFYKLWGILKALCTF